MRQASIAGGLGARCAPDGEREGRSRLALSNQEWRASLVRCSEVRGVEPPRIRATKSKRTAIWWRRASARVSYNWKPWKRQSGNAPHLIKGTYEQHRAASGGWDGR